jgi:glutamate formiminotransferase/formiminotetrahydrofolate cyclodeaminase
MTAALRHAASVPLRVAQCAAEVGALVQALRSQTNPRMSSDLTAAVALARAATEGALANVEINLDALDGIAEAAFISETRATAAGLRNRLRAIG